MYEYFSGELAEKNLYHAVIDIQGIGYKINIPSTLSSQLPEVGKKAVLFVSWVVRELSQTLYGFGSREERDLFEVLISLSGIGPKTGLAMISHFSPEALEAAVSSGDAAALARVPGIGKKTAERLLVDLKGRLKITCFSQKGVSSKAHDALNALLNLGYTQANAEKSVKKALDELSEESDLPALITSALKKINR